MNKENSLKQKENCILGIILCLATLLAGMLFIHLTAFQSYHKEGITTLVPFDSVLFLLIGGVFLGIACFAVIQLRQYKTGRLFAGYALTLGTAILLSSGRWNVPLITLIRVSCIFASSLLLLRVIGYLTLLVNKKLFQIFQIILAGVVTAGMVGQILSLFPLEDIWIYILAEESVNGSIVLSALFCLIVMGVNYRKSNTYAKKQSKILLFGIGSGVICYCIALFLPNVYLVQNRQDETETFVELSLVPGETMMDAIPLLIFSGVSIAIIVMLLQREYVLQDMRFKLKYFIGIPIYFYMINILMLSYANCSLRLLEMLDILLITPCIITLQKVLYSVKKSEEQTYEWRWMEEVEKEKQELSAYLHDEVLQSLIAFYRKLLAEENGQYEDMKNALSALIVEMRSVSHNLYPTMVEDLGLEQSLAIFAEELHKSYDKINIELQYELTDGILPKAFALTFYRTIKELATNAAKHSGGTKITISLKEDENGYYLNVSDNGKGFLLPKNEELLKSPHMGLYTVKRRAAGLNGRINFDSHKGQGTAYQIYFPKGEVNSGA